VRFPTREHIILINRRQIDAYGGMFIPPDNIKNNGSLEWVLDAIQYPLFTVNMYPTIAEKASALAWTIITGHVFHDGNKRTGMSAMDLLLRLNGYRLDAAHEEIVKIAIRAGSARDLVQHCNLEEFTRWVRDRIYIEYY
jgi:death-on-curing protein